jgi:hypothetical protein
VQFIGFALMPGANIFFGGVDVCAIPFIMHVRVRLVCCAVRPRVSHLPTLQGRVGIEPQSTHGTRLRDRVAQRHSHWAQLRSVFGHLRSSRAGNGRRPRWSVGDAR